MARLGAALAVLAVLGVVILGSVRLIGWIWGGEAESEIERVVPGRNDNDAKAAGDSPGQPGRGIRRPESPIAVPIRHQSDDPSSGYAVREMDFSDDTAGTVPWYTHRGWWENREGVLLHDVFMGGRGIVDDRVIPRAFVGG
ncbi:MAG: hypothetical protein ACOC0J_02545, partial [Myxococcota bacterium]